jgi:hypothetical protein
MLMLEGASEIGLGNRAYPTLKIRACRRNSATEVRLLTYIPMQKLNKSQTMTIGAKELASFVIPNGCARKSKTRMAQETPTMVGFPMLGATILIPCIAPSTDWAGVSTPSDMTSATPKTPVILRKYLAAVLRSKKLLADLALPRSSPVRTLSILTIDSSRGSLWTILAFQNR